MGNTLTQLEDSVSKAVSHFTLEVVQPRVISFEDQVVFQKITKMCKCGAFLLPLAISP